MFPVDEQALERCNEFSAQCGIKTYKQVIKYNILSAVRKCTKCCRNSRRVTTRVERWSGKKASYMGATDTRPSRMSSKTENRERLKCIQIIWAEVSSLVEL